MTVTDLPSISNSSPPRVGPIKYRLSTELNLSVIRLPTVAKPANSGSGNFIVRYASIAAASSVASLACPSAR